MLETMAAARRLRLLPPIRRARGWRLYAENGRRFLDLWQDGGRGILGAKGTGLGTAAKAAVDKGLLKPLPSIHEHRLQKELLRICPGFQALRLYGSLDAALAGFARALKLPPPADRDEAILSLLSDPTRRSAPDSEARALVMRPFMPDGSGFLPASPAASEGMAPKASIENPAALVILPCPGPLAPVALLFRKAKGAEHSCGELVPPLFAICAYRSLVELAGYAKDFGEKHWARADRRTRRLFERRGPYLFPRCTEPEYPALFDAALERGLLLSPDYGLPSIIPGDFDDGELKPLDELHL